MPSLESLTQVSDVLLDYIVQGCESMILDEVILLDVIKRSTKDVFGRNILIKYRLKGNAKSGHALERGTLPSAGARTFEEGLATLRHYYIPIEITGQQANIPHGSKGAIFDIILDAFDDAMEHGRHKADNVAWGDGSGRLAQINGTPTYSAGTGLTTVNFDNGKKEQFLESMDVSFGTNSTAWEISTIDEDNDRIYVTGDATAEAVEDVWIYNGGDYDSGFAMVPWGIQIHANNVNTPHSLYQNLDRTATGNSWLNAYVNDRSGAAMTALILTQHFQKIRNRGGGTPTLNITEDGVLNSYVLLLESLHQQIQTMPDKTGTKERYKFVFQGKNLVLESATKCPNGSIYNIDPNVIELRQAFPLQWDKSNGGKLQTTKTQDILWGRMKWYYNIICRNNKKLGVMKDIKRNSIS